MISKFVIPEARKIRRQLRFFSYVVSSKYLKRRCHTIANFASNKFSVILLVSGMTICLAACFVGPFGFDYELSTLRFGRVAMAFITGASLAATGSALQALLKNPLADPFIIGVSGAAALGGSAGMLLFPFISSAASIGASTGALIITLLINLLIQKKPLLSSEQILLMGVVFNTIASAFISLLKTILPAEKTQGLLFWLVGNIPYVSNTVLLFTALPLVLLFILLLKKSACLDILAQGQEEALRLGVDAHKESVFIYFIISIIVGLIVAQTGLIAFVGLIVPNLLRRLFGPSQKFLLPTSMICGAIFLVVADALARFSFVFWATEIPTGSITSIIGGPVFIWILLKNSRA